MMYNYMMTTDQFEKILQGNERCIIKLGATWCQPCKTLDKEIDLLFQEHPEVKGKIYKVDVDEFPELTQRMQIMSVPTCVFVEGNGTYSLKKGMLSRQGLFEWVK